MVKHIQQLKLWQAWRQRSGNRNAKDGQYNGRQKKDKKTNIGLQNTTHASEGKQFLLH